MMAKNKGDRLHNKGCYHKGQYNVTLFCTKRLSIQPKSAWQPILPSAKGLPFTFMYLLLCKSQSILLYSFLFSLLQASCGEERSRHIYPAEYGWASVIIVDIALEVNKLGGETI